MKTVKWLILILLLLALLCGYVLADPLVRFSVDLRAGRFDHAQAVYSARLSASTVAREEAADSLQRYVDRQLSRYYEHRLSHDGLMTILTTLSDADLPQDDIDRCLQAANEMEKARADLVQADDRFASGDYANAIPLYRRSLVADDSARLQLEEAESAYKAQLLEKAESAIERRRVEGIEQMLMAGMSVLGPDDDLSAAMADVHRLKEDQAFDALTAEALQLLTEDGPEAAFRYVADFRQQAPDEYRLEYLEQLLRHEYEENVCSQALSLRDAGRSLDACSLLEEGLRFVDSQRMQILLAEIRATLPVFLSDLPVSLDETANARTGAQSSVAWDQILQDALFNQYEHSVYADLGTLSLSLQGRFELFTGTVAFPQGEKADIYRKAATLQVFGDGKMMAEFKEMDASSAPISFSIPVGGVQELSLVWTSEGANGWKDWGRFATVFDGRLLTGAGA